MFAPTARRLALAAVVLTAVSAGARAATINVSPTDSYAKIEGAGPGDEVVIAPGTYKFRVYLTQQAPPGRPITIRAADPTNPPVWDLSADLVESAPGSYTAGDKGRGCWQLSGATNIHISGLVITGCHNATANSAGLRYYEGTSGIVLSDVVFRDNDNGLTGGSQSSEIQVEFCEFDSNGTLLAPSSAPSHNIYVYGGNFTLRYSYVHDPVQGQNFHIRAQQSVIEYNWFARAKSYQGDLMTSDDYDGTGTFTQNMTFRGNVIFQGTSQSNGSQIIAVYNDTGVGGLTLNASLLYNTFVGPTGGHAALVHLSNADGTSMSAELDDNLMVGIGSPVLVETAATAHVSGTHNWLPTGVSAAGLTETVFGSNPMFNNAAAEDFTLAASSTAIGAAQPPTLGTPDREYYKNETVTRMYRLRASAQDIGAFESSTTGSGVGPYGPSGGTDGGAGSSGATGGTGGPGGSSGTGGFPGTGGLPGTGGAAGSGAGGGGNSGGHSGGASGNGGSRTGGASGGGGNATGGRGGTFGGTGGSHTGGSSGSGGGGHTGGTSGTGGTHTGGASGSGGGRPPATGGTPGTGGSGGIHGTGGAPMAGAPGGGSGNGCSCTTGGSAPHPAGLLLLVIGAALARRRSRRA
jgi:MYXO-CTERM domain-containing protein